MDWGFIAQMILAIVGAALVAGGLVGYRGSARTSVKAFAAAAVASGTIMWLIVIMTIPVSVSQGS